MGNRKFLRSPQHCGCASSWHRSTLPDDVVWAAGVWAPSCSSHYTNATAALTTQMHNCLFLSSLPDGIMWCDMVLFCCCRCTGLSIGHNISMAVFGGTAPMMATALLQGTGDIASPAALLIVAAALTAVGALQLRRWKIR